MRIVLVALVAVVALAGCDWAQLGFGPDETNDNPSEPAITPTSVRQLNTAWSTLINVTTPPLVAHGLVYTEDTNNDIPPRDFTIAARDEATGAVRWSLAIRQVTDARFMGIGNGLAYVRVGSLTGDGALDTSDVVLALDAMTGQLRWFLQAPDPSNFQDKLVTIRAFLLDGSRLFLVTSAPGSGYFVSAYDTGGHSIWSASVLGTLDSIVADPGRTLHAVSFVQLNPDGTGIDVLTSYSESSGTVTAQRFADFAPRGAVISPPMSFGNGVIYADTVSGNHNEVVAVRVSDGVQLWNALDESVGAVAPGAVITLDRAVTARNPLTGAVLWSRPGATFADPQSAVVAGGVVFARQSGGAFAFRLSDGTVLNSTPAGSLITVADGRVVVANGAAGLEVLTPAG
jgi:outer membrane protein assembly factor BamB